MVSFAQPLFWQIRYLVTGLTKKNYKSSVSELHHLISLYGYDAQVFFLRTLIEEIQFQDAKHGGGQGRDQLKVQLLQNELREIESEEQFGVLLCQAVEASREGGVLEDFVTHVCKVAKVQLRGQLSLAVACLQSTNEVTHREGAKFLRTKLREYVSPGGRGQRLSEPLLHQLLASLRGTELEEAIPQEHDRESLFKQLVDLHPDVDVSRGPCAGLLASQKPSSMRFARQDKRSVIVDVPLIGGGAGPDGVLLDGVRACDIVEEIGRGSGGASVQAIHDVLSLFPGLGTKGLAELVCMTVRTSGTHCDPHSTLAAGVLTAAVRDSWNDPATPVFHQTEAASDRAADSAHEAASMIEAVSECISDARWAEVFEMIFDLPDLRISDARSFQALLAAHRAACGSKEQFPLAVVLRKRKNTAAQLQFLRHAAECDASMVDFSYVPPLVEPVPGLPGAEDAEQNGGPNHCWACRAFIEALFELAEAEDYGAVRRIFNVPLQKFPEALLISICHAEDRSQGALRTELMEKLMPPLFDEEGPYSTLVQSTLAERTPGQLKWLLRSLQERYPQHGLERIMSIFAKDELVSFYASLLQGPPTELSCRLALLGSNRGALSLTSWLSETLNEHKDAGALGLIRFLRVRLQPPPAVPGKADSTSPLPAGTDEFMLYKTFLDALHEATPKLTSEPARQVREIAQLAHQRFPALTPAPPLEAPPAPSPPPTDPPPGPPPQQMSPTELEESSNRFFCKIYTGEMTVPQLIEIMKDFAANDKGSWKHEVYSRMIQNLFDECRFFPKYPPQELTTTGELFGSLINHDLVHAPNLGLALRCVLEALRRPMHKKFFRFGILALEQFLDKLPVWPQLCHHLTQIEHLEKQYPTYVEYAKNVLKALPEELRHSTALKPEVLQSYPMPKAPPKAVPPPGAAPPPPSSAPEPPPAAVPKPGPPAGTPPAGPAPPASAAEASPGSSLRATSDSVVTPSSPGAPSSAPVGGATASSANPAAAAVGGALMFSGAHTVDSLLNDPELQIEKPPMWMCDMTAQIFNSLVKDNVEQKVEEMRQILQTEYYPWLAYYLVKNRASKEVNFHGTYIEFFEKLRQPRLLEMVTNMTYDCLRVLLKSVDQAVVSTSHRTVLKNLGYWLGQITLARNKPLKSKNMDLKNALLDAYENGRLTAVLPLVCKVLEGVQRSKVYKLPNPWTTAIMSLLAEIHDVPNLRTNLMFEVEVLCKHLEIKISDLKRSDLVVGKRPPPNSNDLSSAARQAPTDSKNESSAGSTKPAEGSASAAGPPLLRSDAVAWSGLHGNEAPKDDENRVAGGTSLTGLGLGQGGYHAYGGGDSLLPLLPNVSGIGGSADRGGGHGGSAATGASHAEDFIISNLPSLVTINSQIPLFQVHTSLRTLVPHAVDRAIKEVISAVVERSVTISCLTTREMVTKDFAMEPDENMLKKAAQLMVSSVAGSLALVTCREPLRVSLTNHLWQLLLPHCGTKDMNETAALEQVVHILSTENLELGCNLIEKAVVEKALKDIEESIAPAIQARKDQRARNPNVTYYDTSYIQPTSKWPQALPDMLRPKPGPLTAQQLKVYKDFNSMPTGAAKARLPAGLPPLNVAGVTNTSPAPTIAPQEPPPFLASQAAGTAGAGLGLGGPVSSGGDTLTTASMTSSSAAAGVRLGFGRNDAQVSGDFDLTQSPRGAAGTSPIGPENAASAIGEDMRLGEGEPAAAVPLDVQQALASLMNSVEQAIQGLLNNPPLLPPIDSANPQLYKQEDALEACTALSLLPLDHELVTLLRQVPHRVAQSSHVETCALDLAQRIFKRLYEAPQTVPQVHPPDTVSLLHLMVEVYLGVLDMLRDPLKEQLAKVLVNWVDDVTGAQRYNVDVISGLLRYQLVNLSDFDRLLAKWIETRPREAHGAINAPAVDFAVMLLQRVCLRQRALSRSDFPTTLEALHREAARGGRQYQHGQLQMPSPLSPQEMQLVDSASKVIDELHSAEAPTTGRSRQTLSAKLAERVEEEQRQRSESTGDRGETASSREMIINIFEEWHSMYNASPDGVQNHARGAGNQTCTIVLQRITTAGFIRSEEAMERFFRVCCEHAVQRAFSDAQQSSATDEVRERDRNGEAPTDQASRDSYCEQADYAGYSDAAPGSLHFVAIDSFTRLIVLLMKCADKVQMLTRALSAIARVLIRDCEIKERQFNQRPYFRILLNLLMDVSAPDPNFEQANFQLLSAFCNTFHTCNPMRVPNFAFAWLELISNRMFMPKLLMVRHQRGWLMFQRLLVQLLYFLEPYLRRVQLNDSTRLLYKGTVRMLLVLLHDFPEFLCDYHFSFCDIIPIPCVQIRNLILSAFPRNMKLPDPFMPNLKVDLLPEIKIAPRILASYTTTLLQLHLKADVDNYMRTREKRLLDVIKDKLRLPKSDTLQLDTKYNVPLLNALLLYVGVHLPQHGKQLPGQGLQQNNPSLEIFMHLAHHFDYEGRYLFLSAIANHLRYPNTHTHYFSCVLLYLFADTNDEVVREQITRVLLERLIVHRPHPWGLLITFIELIKNRRYEFWNHSFVKCAPEVEKLFQSVAYTCLGTTIDRQSEGEQRTKIGAGNATTPALANGSAAAGSTGSAPGAIAGSSDRIPSAAGTSPVGTSAVGGTPAGDLSTAFATRPTMQP